MDDLLTVTDPNSHTTAYTYTPKDQVETITDAAAGVTFVMCGRLEPSLDGKT